ncbi:MAG: hypothetical protein ACJ77A_08170 [Actinomycetota bacterium]
MARRSTKKDATSVDEVVDRLYSLDAEDFTVARNEAAKQLKAEGDKAGSDLVKGLRKPTTAAWAVNQLSRRVPKQVDELLEAGAALRSAQRAALSGSGKALRDATQRRRAVVARLLEEAAAVFGDAGRNPAPHVDAIRSTLEAASTDEATGDLVRSGRLTKEVEPPTGFGDVSPFEVLTGGRASPAAKAEEAPAASPAERRLRERLEARVEKAEDALSAAREAAAEARREADDAARDSDRLERELQTARRRADRAAKSATAAESRAEKAEQALTQAQADLKTES